MDEDAQRIAILSSMGWSELKRTGRRGDDGPLGALRGTSPDGKRDQIAPNPLTNLNAIHEAEEWLVANTRLAWQYYLNLGRNGGNFHQWSKIHATAPQRCEAFLRTLNLWSTGSEAGE